MIIGLVQINKLNNSTVELTRSSVPVFIRTQEIERNLKSLLLLLQAVDNATSISELEPLKKTFINSIQSLRDEITQLGNTDSPDNFLMKMKQALPKIETDAVHLFASKRDVLLFTLTLSQADVLLEESGRLIRSALENLAFEASSNINQPLAPTIGDKAHIDHIQEKITQEYSLHLGQASAITELTLKVESVIDAAISMHNIQDSSELDQIVRDIRFKSSGIAILIGQLDDHPPRHIIAEEFITIRAIIFNNMGILDQVRLVQERRIELEQHRAAQITPILQISEFSNQLARAARTQVSTAATDLTKTSNQMRAVLIMSGLFSILIFVCATFMIVERQINQRMYKLTRAVTAIAAGKTDYDVDVEGNDELGEMAIALETFKTNAEELRRSNTELEKFAYAAAHDLRSPLRAIQDLAEWTVEDEENKFSEEGQQNMGLLRARVNRLNLLLSDLLTYSRAGKEHDDLTELCMTNAVALVGELLDPQNRFNITYFGTSSDIITYSTPLRQILMNLISNSIKHHDKDHGSITVTGAVRHNRLIVTVRDDGPGIEPQYHDRIFGLFQTLRPRDEVEGSGLGLSIIRKLVEHYRGTIRIHSEPKVERGTTFEFDLPEKTLENSTQDKAA